ncbi:MAG: shikimate kinase, partial [Acidaminococcaceae bacterium]|nr:shikimate kinase [Acidaminococcaceae bacterium]
MTEMKNIVLIGMPGCGKSTLGRYLAEILGRDFIDADPEIEKDAGKTIPELFAVSEDHFRRQETETVKRLSRLEDKVLAMGGGVVLRQENID